MRVFGHRGAAAVAPENTRVSFAAAMDAGADGVECDVRLSADGALVLMHDEDVSRTTDGSGRVSAMTLAQLRALNAAAGHAGFGRQPVPTADDVWESTRGRVIFEIKGSSFDAADPKTTAAALVDYLAGRDAGAAIVSSFDPAVIAVVRDRAPAIATGLLGAAAFDPISVVEAAVAEGHAVVFPAEAVVTASVIESAHEAGLTVIPWTVNDPARLREIKAWGADGVITDDPAAALRALA